MQSRPRPLLCELHAHTTWSDGDLTPTELVDLYGRSGFDVLAVTDHAIRADDPWPDRPAVRAPDFPAYLDEIESQARRARALYDLLVLPGLELTYEDADPLRAAHAVAVGLREHVSLDGGLEQALDDARAAGAALIAAHPYEPSTAPDALRTTGRWAVDHDELASLVDRFELVNRRELFGWVAAAGLPAVATGDFHTLQDLWGWKTLLPCLPQEDAVIAHLRSDLPAYLVDLAEPALLQVAA
jgi:predicted metal-dependent phosphoesterase TrpH